MSDLISRGKLFNLLAPVQTLGEAYGIIQGMETVDAVTVRCKDCKYFDSGTDEDGKLFFKCLGWVYGGTSEDDFCSHGERKDGDGSD